MEEQIINTTKPQDWPENNRELRISTILEEVQIYEKNPNYKNKEKLLSLVKYNDLNERNDLGLYRITEYEIYLINKLYILGKKLNFNGLIMYLYENIISMTRQYKMTNLMLSHDGEKLENAFWNNELLKLEGSLNLFYIIYANFNYYKDRSFTEEIKTIINDILIEKLLPIEGISYSLNLMMYDLSCFSNLNTIPILELNRKEIKEIMSLIAKLLEKTHSNITRSPLRGVFKIMISNWILKSRNNYNTDPLIKYMDDNVVINAFNNHEIWMRKIEKLNDKREQKVIKELYSNKKWINKEWAKNIKLDPVRVSYVSSFSKSKKNSKMEKEYGTNLFGYKNDRISEVLTPIIKFPKLGTMFSQVVFYDILYDRNAAREELNYLFEIIDLFHITDKEKNIFLNEIIQYWLLSFKDKKWEHEKERRYQIFIYDNYDYIDFSKDDDFLKIKSTIFLYPDFVSKENIKHEEIKSNKNNKYKNIATKPYLFCNNCLNTDFDSVQISDNPNLTCPICDSSAVEIRNNLLIL